MTRPSVFGPDVDALKPQEEVPVFKKIDPEKLELVAQKGIIKTSNYLPIEIYERLREIAFHERVKMHDLFMEGIDHVLRKRRHPGVDELKKRS